MTPRRPDAGNQGGANNMAIKKEVDADRLDEFRKWVASRKAAGATIDIETCELYWVYAYTSDPYGLFEAESSLTRQRRRVGRVYFVRSPDNNGPSAKMIFHRPSARRCGPAVNAATAGGKTRWMNSATF
jgi:hypothetical protein